MITRLANCLRWSITAVALLTATLFLTPAAHADAPAVLKVWVPEDATVEINGATTRSTGWVREFRTPALPTNRASEYVLTGTWTEEGQSVSVKQKVKVWGGHTTRVDLRRPKKWPDYTRELSGEEEVRIVNPNDYRVAVGLRVGGIWGKDFIVPAQGERTVYVPSGDYEIYFQYLTERDRKKLLKGDDFSLPPRTRMTIRLVKSVLGNYGVREIANDDE